MSVGLGYKSFLGLKTCSSWGGVATSDKWVDINSEGIKVTEDRIHSASLYSVNTNLNEMARGKVSVGGDFSTDCRYEGLETLFLHAFGDETPTTLSGGAFKHTFTIADALPDYGVSLEIFRDGLASNVSFVVDSAKINTMNLAIDTEGILVATFGVLGHDLTTAASTSPTASTKDLVIFSEGVLQWGNSTREVKNFSVALNNNLTERRFIGSRYSSEPCRGGKIEVTGSFTCEFDGAAEYNDFRAATNRALVLTFTGDTISGQYSYQYKLICNVAVLTDVNPNVGGPGPITVSVPFKSYLSGSDKEIKLEIVNTISGAIS